MDERTARSEQGNRDTRKRIGFKPRFIPPEKNNDCYYSNKNIFHRAGYGLPNCTAYAYGRILENAPNKSFNKLTGNGGKWYDQAIKAGYKVGTEPKLGAIICWTSKGAGHVAVVEKIYPNGDITCSNSAWKGTLFYTTTHFKTQNYNFTGYAFKGFIYIL